MITEAVCFNLGDIPTEWTFEHNLEDFGQTLFAAFDCWLARTKKITPQSFMGYVLSKNRFGYKFKIKQL